MANSAAGHLNDKKFHKIFKQNCLLVTETAKFMIEMKNEQVNGFSQRVREMCKENGLVEIEQKVTLDPNGKNEANIEALNHLLFKKNSS